MASGMASMYRAIREVVRLAASYLRRVDVRTNDVMEELEIMTAGIGLDDEDVQFPASNVIKTDLQERLPCMADRGGMVEVLRYVVEKPDEKGNSDITLEVWKITRKMHVMVREIGNLYSVAIKWGLFTIPLNIIAVKTGECEEEDCPVVLETGDGVAFLVRQFDWATFRVFFYEEEEISAGQRLLFMAMLDADKFPGLSVEDFAQWDADLVYRELDRRCPGEVLNRFTAEQAGLVPVERPAVEGGEALMEEESPGTSTLVASTDRITAEEASLEDLGQSPVLSTKGEKSKLVEGCESPEIREVLRDEIEEEEEMIDAIEFTGLNRAGERVVLTTKQMIGIASMMSGCVRPRRRVRSKEKQFDPIEFLRSVQESDPGARLIRVKKSDYHQGDSSDEEDHRQEDQLSEEEAAGDHEEESVEGREMWSEDESEDWETEVMPDVSVSESDVTQGSVISSIKSPRAELSYQGGDSSRDTDPDLRSPAAKKMRWSEKEEQVLTRSPIVREWTPDLAKVDDGRQVITISTSSGSSGDEVKEEKVPVGKRRVKYPGTNRTELIPDNDICEDVFNTVFSECVQGETGEETARGRGDH